jgi:hypothetical protein
MEVCIQNRNSVFGGLRNRDGGNTRISSNDKLADQYSPSSPKVRWNNIATISKDGIPCNGGLDFCLKINGATQGERSVS